MTSIIERVARAICVAAGHDPDMTHDIHVPGDPVAGHAWAGYRSMARAAIEAMREPTDAMQRAIVDASTLEGAPAHTGSASWEAA